MNRTHHPHANVGRLVITLAALVTCLGCGDFMDDGSPPNTSESAQEPIYRGFTECGDYVGETQYCQPGQYCENALWNRCEIGCLSDVNCASNQSCIITVPNEPGYCQNR